MRQQDILKHSLQVLTNEQRRFYFDNGYLLVERCLDDDTVNRLRVAMTDLIERAETPSDCPRDFEFETTAKGRHLRQVLCAADHHPDLWDYARGPILTELAADLVGPDVMFREATISFKSPGGRGFDWHQDIVFFPSSNLSPLMMLTFLEDVTLDMGPTRVIPGTHRGPVFDHYDSQGNWLGLIGEHHKKHLCDDEAVDVTGPAGSILVTNCALVHSALPNHSVSRRPMVVMGYQSADAISYTDIPYQSRYKWEIVRGLPSPYVHTEAYELKMPPDWAEHKGVRIDNLYQ